MASYTADFETTTDINDCRVWAWGVCDIAEPSKFKYGNDINSFMKYISSNKGDYFFHNLKFDGEFIIHWLLSNEYTFIKDKKERDTKTFTCLISDMGIFYSIEIYFYVSPNKKKINKVTIYDSLKLLNFSVDKIAKDFDLPVRKLEIDYHEKREVGHELTEQEVDYLHNDVYIMALALKIMQDNKMNKMTIGSCALSNYKEYNLDFKTDFPLLNKEDDDNIRQAYKGGFTYLNPAYEEKESGGRGVVLDVNSLYPSVMHDELLPYDYPLLFMGEYKYDEEYPLYVQVFSCQFDIKKNKIPTIQLKNHMSFIPNEYIPSSRGKEIILALTSVDLELMKTHYDLNLVKYMYGYKFKAKKGMFTSYIDYWTSQKIESKKNGNKSMYTISKLMLNSLYGKFGLSTSVRNKYPYLDDGVVKYEISDKSDRNGIYIPMACFITSYARRKTISTSQAIKEYTINKYGKDMYIYSDTDSIHTTLLDEDELKSIVDIDEYRLGAWKIESEFVRGKYLHQKCYIEQSPTGEMNVTIAGLPKKVGKYVNFDNFKRGFDTADLVIAESDCKLMYRHCKGGVVLVKTDFKIK